MKVKKLRKQFSKWVRKAVEISRSLFRRSRKAIRRAWVKHTQLMRCNPGYRKAFAAAASKIAARVVVIVPTPFAIPARALALAVSLYLAAESMA